MPGIAGLITANPTDRAKSKLVPMVECMLHENWYSSGTFENLELGLYAGWICHAESFCDCMPVFNERQDIIMIFQGEDFPDQELFNGLKSRNHKFNSWDASYIVHMYEEFGDDFLVRLNGCFSGIIVDIRKKRVTLFNDRYSMEKIYYYEGKDCFYFSSEAKSLLKACPELRAIDERGLGEFFYCQGVLENRTLFRNVFLMPPASMWTFENGKVVKKESYFDPRDWENQPWLEKEFFYEGLKDTLTKILPRYLRSKETVALSLTGGLDTRIILALSDIPSGRMPCFTHAGILRDSYDVIIAHKVAEFCGLSHHAVRLDQNFLKKFPELAEKAVYLTDGTTDVTAAPNLFLERSVRNIAKIRLTGNYGGQVLRGVRGFKPSPPNISLFDKSFLVYLEKAAPTLDYLRNGNVLSFILFKQIPWLQHSRVLVEKSQLVQRSPYLDNDLVSLMHQCAPQNLSNKEMSIRLIADGNPGLAGIPTDRGIFLDNKISLINFLHLYREFLFKMDYYYSHGMSNKMASIDHGLAFRGLERFFLGHHKYYHFRPWFRDQLSGYVRDILLSSRALDRPYLNRRILAEMVNAHMKGSSNYAIPLSQFLTAELIHRLFIDNR